MCNKKDWTPLYDVIDLKHIRFQSSTQINKPDGSKRIHSGERFQNYAVSVCGLTGLVKTESQFVTKGFELTAKTVGKNLAGYKRVIPRKEI